MTEFMERVEESLRADPAPAPSPAVAASVHHSVGQGAHEMVELRSLAEQLVSEANAVLASRGRVVELDDEAGGSRLAFRLRCGTAWADIVTSFAQRESWGQLVTPDSAGERVELTGTDALADLVVALILAADGAAVSTTTTDRS